jgi:hypothetical protein
VLTNWRLEAAAGTKKFILTLTTPDDFEIAFYPEAESISDFMSAPPACPGLFFERIIACSRAGEHGGNR